MRILEVSHGTTSCGRRARDRLRLAGAYRSRMGARLEPFPGSGDGAPSERGMSAVYGECPVSRAGLGACLSAPPDARKRPAAILAHPRLRRLGAGAAPAVASLTPAHAWDVVVYDRRYEVLLRGNARSFLRFRNLRYSCAFCALCRSLCGLRRADLTLIHRGGKQHL